MPTRPLPLFRRLASPDIEQKGYSFESCLARRGQPADPNAYCDEVHAALRTRWKEAVLSHFHCHSTVQLAIARSTTPSLVCFFTPSPSSLPPHHRSSTPRQSPSSSHHSLHSVASPLATASSAPSSGLEILNVSVSASLALLLISSPTQSSDLPPSYISSSISSSSSQDSVSPSLLPIHSPGRAVLL